MSSYKKRPRSTLLRAGTATRLASSSPLQSNAQLASSLSSSTATSTPLLDQLGGVSEGTSTGTSSGSSSGDSTVFTPNPDADLPSPQNAPPDLDALKAKLTELMAAREYVLTQLEAYHQQLSQYPNTPQYAGYRAQLLSIMQSLQQWLAQVDLQIKEVVAQIEEIRGGSSGGQTYENIT